MITVERISARNVWFCRGCGSDLPDVLTVGPQAHCMPCNIKGVRKLPAEPWYFTGSPHGPDIIALGLEPLERIHVA